MVLGGQKPFFRILIPQHVQHIGVFRVDEHRHAVLRRLLHGFQQLEIVHVHRRRLIRHEHFHGGHAHLHQLRNLLQRFLAEIGTQRMERNIGDHLPLRPDLQAVVDGIDQGLSGIVGRKVHHRGGAAQDGHIGGVIAGVEGHAVAVQGFEMGVPPGRTYLPAASITFS